jgi:predicted NodU family carbamoyl transferase
MNILGITSDSGGFHDSSVALVQDGRITLALSEERYTRVKHDATFPERALQDLLRLSGLGPSDFAAVGVAWKPYNPFSGFFKRSIWDVPRTVMHTFVVAPNDTARYAARNFIGKKMIGSRNRLVELGFRPEQLHYVSHHLAHAASSYRTSGFESALSVNLDCFGPDDQGNLWSGSSFLCSGNEIQLIEHIPPHGSLGLFYSAISVCLGFRFGDGEGKTMGLAAYGDRNVAYHEIRAVAPCFTDGVWYGPEAWSDFRLIDNPGLLFRTKWGGYVRDVLRRRRREDIAAAAQRILEEELGKYFDYLLPKTGERSIVLAGGIFLNVTFNRILASRPDVERVFIHPFPSDGGTAAGAALEVAARLLPKGVPVNYEMPSAALGREYSDDEIASAMVQFGDALRVEKASDIARATAHLIATGEIVGWFQGRGEWGPRALGHRSVLGDPRKVGTKERLNRLLKSRDWFMPFAPSIIEEAVDLYLDGAFYAPFMTFAFKVKPEAVEQVSQIVHRDGTARPNVVRREVDPLYHALISQFRQLTGVPIVLNTSFNRHGLPLVNTPVEAVEHLLWGCVDSLAIGSFVVHRQGSTKEVPEGAARAQREAYVDDEASAQALG